MKNKTKITIGFIIAWLLLCILISISAYGFAFYICNKTPLTENLYKPDQTTEIITEEVKCTVIFKNSYQDTNYYIGVYIDTNIEVIEVTKEYYDEIDVGDIILVEVSGDKLSVYRYG